MRLSPQDVAFVELVVFATLSETTLMGLEDLESTYDGFVRDAIAHTGSYEVTDDNRHVISVLEVYMCVARVRVLRDCMRWWRALRGVACMRACVACVRCVGCMRACVRCARALRCVARGLLVRSERALMPGQGCTPAVGSHAPQRWP